MGRRKKLYMLDGKPVTIDEAAEALGMKTDALLALRYRHNNMSLQMLADYRRQGYLGSHAHKYGAAYLVDGEWITVKDAADRLGVTVKALRKTMRRHKNADGTPFTLSDTVRYYREMREGKHPQGKKGIKYPFRGKRMTIPEIAQARGLKAGTIYMRMIRDEVGAEEAVLRIEARREKTAENRIMWIVWGKRPRRKKTANECGSAEC